MQLIYLTVMQTILSWILIPSAKEAKADAELKHYRRIEFTLHDRYLRGEL